MSEMDCVLKEFGNCSYSETGCSDCKVKEKIRNTLSVWPEPCEDAVSRADAIRWVKTECNPYGKPTLDFESGKKVIEHLERMSPVTPKQRTGKWMNLQLIPDDITGRIYGKCSICGRLRIVDNFCPNCGAEMDGSE